MRYRPTIVIPAAGLGSRFDGPTHKLAQPFGGSTVLGSTVRHAIGSQLPVLVVTTEPLAAQVSQWLATRDIVVLAPGEAARGMAHSIAIGVSERPGAPGWLVLPGDMPLVRTDSILAVATALEHDPIVFAQHRGRRGHPVGFAAELYSELIALDGDDGARRLLARYPSQAVELDDEGVLVDVDTRSELAAAREVHGARAETGHGR